jgi:hypothetical protein
LVELGTECPDELGGVDLIVELSRLPHLDRPKFAAQRFGQAGVAEQAALVFLCGRAVHALGKPDACGFRCPGLIGEPGRDGGLGQ